MLQHPVQQHLRADKRHRRSYPRLKIIAVRRISSPKVYIITEGVYHHRQVHIIAARRISSPSGAYHHRQVHIITEGAYPKPTYQTVFTALQSKVGFFAFFITLVYILPYFGNFSKKFFRAFSLMRVKLFMPKSPIFCRFSQNVNNCCIEFNIII